MTIYVEKIINKNMASEQELKNNPLHKEFQNLLDKDFKDRKLKKTDIKSTVKITKNFVVVDCKANGRQIPLRNLKLMTNLQN